MTTTAKTPAPQHPGFVAALATAQGELPRVAKAETANVQTKTGHRYQYSYASLADIHAAILPVLSRNGLAWTTMPTIKEDGRYVLRCELSHVSGENRICEMPLPSVCTPQELGSALTYARRYAFCSMVGIAPDEDDDGAAAELGAATTREPERAPRPPAQQRPSRARRPTPPTKQTTTPRQDQDPIAILDVAVTMADQDWHRQTWRQVDRNQALPADRLTNYHWQLLRAAGADPAQVATIGDALRAIGQAVKTTGQPVISLVAPTDVLEGAETDADGA